MQLLSVQTTNFSCVVGRQTEVANRQTEGMYKQTEGMYKHFGLSYDKHDNSKT